MPNKKKKPTAKKIEWQPIAAEGLKDLIIGLIITLFAWLLDR